ncbi:MAG: hypothetical protein MI974_21005 [Chitinophagales bacterium]|nr:hypothetical protein [Chitinophagales bacterium]
MIKSLIFSLLFVFVTLSGNAQSDCSVFFPFRKGAVMEYTSYDRKGKVENITENKVISVMKSSDGSVEAELATIVRNKKGKEEFSGAYEVSCQDGILQIDVTSMLNPGMLQSFQGMEISIDGDYVTLPNELEEGSVLTEATTKISAGTNGISIINMTINIKDRKVDGIERVTTPAGTFDCYKLLQTTEVNMMITKSFDSIEYYAEGVGIVRSETLDDDGEVIAYMELTAFEKP